MKIRAILWLPILMFSGLMARADCPSKLNSAESTEFQNQATRINQSFYSGAVNWDQYQDQIKTLNNSRGVGCNPKLSDGLYLNDEIAQIGKLQYSHFITPVLIKRALGKQDLDNPKKAILLSMGIRPNELDSYLEKATQLVRPQLSALSNAGAKYDSNTDHWDISNIDTSKIGSDPQFAKALSKLLPETVVQKLSDPHRGAVIYGETVYTPVTVPALPKTMSVNSYSAAIQDRIEGELKGHPEMVLKQLSGGDLSEQEEARAQALGVNKRQMELALKSAAEKIKPFYAELQHFGLRYNASSGWDFSGLNLTKAIQNPDFGAALKTFFSGSTCDELLSTRRTLAVTQNGTTFLPPDPSSGIINSQRTVKYVEYVQKQKALLQHYETELKVTKDPNKQQEDQKLIDIYRQRLANAGYQEPAKNRKPETDDVINAEAFSKVLKQLSTIQTALTSDSSNASCPVFRNSLEKEIANSVYPVLGYDLPPQLGKQQVIPTSQGGCDSYHFENNPVLFSKYDPPSSQVEDQNYPRHDAPLYRGMGEDQYNFTSAIQAMLGDPAQFVGSRGFTALRNALITGNANSVQNYLDKYKINDDFRTLVACQPGGFKYYQACLYAADLMDKGIKHFGDDYISNTLFFYHSGQYDDNPDSVVFSSVHPSISAQYRPTVTTFDNSSQRAIDLNYWNAKRDGNWTQGGDGVEADFGEFLNPGYIRPDQIRGYDNYGDYSYQKYEKNGIHYVLLFDTRGTQGVGRAQTSAGEKFFILTPDHNENPRVHHPENSNDSPLLMGVLELCPNKEGCPTPPTDVLAEFSVKTSDRKLDDRVIQQLNSITVGGYPVRYFETNPSPKIHILSATWGANVGGAANNAFQPAQYCENYKTCNYRVSKKHLPGVSDPDPSKPKDFSITWQCVPGDDTSTHTLNWDADAENVTKTLKCPWP